MARKPWLAAMDDRELEEHTARVWLEVASIQAERQLRSARALGLQPPESLGSEDAPWEQLSLSAQGDYERPETGGERPE